MAKLWGWFTNNPIAQIITAFVLALIGWEVVKRNIQETGRIKERERIAAAQAEEQRRVEAARREITEGNHEAAKSADEAVGNMPKYSSTGELRARDATTARVVLDDH